MKKKIVANIIVSICVLLFSVYIQVKSSMNMSIIYIYCFYNMICELKGMKE